MTNTYRRTLITTREEFRSALREALVSLATSDCREVWLCDRDFADWPLDEPAVVDALTQWALPHRKLVVIAETFNEVARRHPHWARFRVTWAHVVDCRTPEASADVDLPVLLLADRKFVVRLAHPDQFRGVATNEPAELVPSREAVDAIAQRSEPAFPASQLGL